MLPNPFYQPVYFDSCAFDGGDESEQQASVQGRVLLEENGGTINILHSVRKEIDFPNTPQWVKDIANNSIYTIEVRLTHEEQLELRTVQQIIVGNGNLEKRGADCRHVYEAIKYGRYFVTTDNGILNQSVAIKNSFNTLFIIRPTEFLDIVTQHIN